MRSPLFWKLFALQLSAASLLLALALMVSAEYSSRAFVAHLLEQERATVAAIAQELAVQYEKSEDLLEAAIASGHFPQTRRPPEHRAGVLPPPLMPPPDDGMPPPMSGPPESQRELGRQTPAAKSEPAPPLQLLDVQGRPLIGDSGPERGERLAIRAQGELLGYLRWQHFPGLNQEATFKQNQMRSYLVIFAVGVGLSGGLSLLISAVILRPLRQLYGATSALARRDFTARLPETSRDELGLLAREFNRLAQTLESYESRQKQWLADISHELRTPIAGLRAQIEAIQDGVQQADDQVLAVLAAQVGRLNALVDDLHMLTLGESGALNLQSRPGDVSVLVKTLGELYALRFSEAGFQFELSLPEPGPQVKMDAHYLEQALANLLENCLRYAVKPGPVRLSVNRRAGYAEITVSDAGPGVPEASLPRLFDRLYRVEMARTRNTGGSGLGLAICRAIVEAHGGRVEATGNAQGGLDMMLLLPEIPHA